MSEPTFRLPMKLYNPRVLAVTLAWLRVCAVVGQFFTIVVVADVFGLPIAQTALLAGVFVLAAFDVFVGWRLRQPWPVGENEVVAHLAVDTGVLCYLLYLTGGATNPFFSLYIVPIALAAMALPRRHLIVSVGIACLAYLAGLLWHRPLPEAMAHPAQGLLDEARPDFNLYMAGMAVDFMIAAALLGFFIHGLARNLRMREAAMQRERERALRDEGILAIATQAAGAAHELNTPLSTIRTLLGELHREHAADASLCGDLALLAGQADRCRDILRELVAVGRAQLAGQATTQTLREFVADCSERLHLLRPAIDLDVAVAETPASTPLRIVPALRHAILNLLNNAADASALAQSGRVEFSAKHIADGIAIEVRDYGPGLPQAVIDAGDRGFVSDKHDGLGLGLALTNSTIERLQGRLRAGPAAGGGTITRLTLPLSALSET